MKKIGMPLLCAVAMYMCMSCAPKGQQNVKTPENQEALAAQLVQEADSLLQTDALCSPFMHGLGNIPANGDAIKSKLDSALVLNPQLEKAYVSKVNFLLRSGLPKEGLQVLRQMDEKLKNPMNADLRSLKAVLEDVYGTPQSAQSDFAKADSCYEALIGQHKSDDAELCESLKIVKALNLSLMKDDFGYYKKAVKAFNATHESQLKELDGMDKIKTKTQFYNLLFKEKSAPKN